MRLGLQLTRDGKITFNKATFTSTLTSNPELVQRMVSGTPASTAPDGTAVPAVAGIADRLLSLAKSATNSTTGTVTMLAKGRDALAKDIQTRIDDWDLRLAARKATLSRQFTAMESALSSLKSQSSWLSGQLSSLSS
ncbi:flagellar filament capping protein FliD [Geodermatophilus sp. URMC 62]|uniref:flagellar filament capping protein FliD n=1 Tax=Geodermatophilus sp. URMC 62 TaxID=3423414 RepID=UPI00406C86CC